MKKFLGVLLALSVFTSSFAVGTSVAPLPVSPAKIKAGEVFIPIGKTGHTISLLDLSRIKVKDLETITGEKMKFAEKASFKLAQKQLAKSINADGTINDKKLNKLAAKSVDGSGFNLGGFALGFLLGLIGVLIAYLINDDKKAARTKWAWIGLAVWVVLLLIFFIL
jgi:hypothetical protein